MLSPSLPGYHPVTVSAAAVLRDMGTFRDCRVSYTWQAQTAFLLRTCFVHWFPCLVAWIFFSCHLFPCLFSSVLLTQTHKVWLMFYPTPSVFSPSRFSLFLSSVSSNALPWSRAAGGSFQYHCFETNLLGSVMDGEMPAEWCRHESLTSLKFEKVEAIFGRSAENWGFC